MATDLNFNITTNKSALSPRTLKRAREELNETPEVIKTNCKVLRALLEDEKELVCPTDEEFLLRFLRARKHNTERAFKLLKNYYVMRRNNMEIFKNHFPLALKDNLEKRVQCILPVRDNEGRHVFIFKAGAWNPYDFSLDEVFRMNYLFMEEMISTQETQINGLIMIVDFTGMGMAHIRSFTPKQAQRLINLLQDCFPARFKEFHLTNQPYLFQILWAITKPFLNEKTRKRVCIHGSDFTELHKRIDKRYLPDTMGGDAVQQDDQALNNLYARNKYYKRMQAYGYGMTPF